MMAQEDEYNWVQSLVVELHDIASRLSQGIARIRDESERKDAEIKRLRTALDKSHPNTEPGDEEWT
jgi:hypothetical protein